MTVPDVIGARKADALRELREAGLRGFSSGTRICADEGAFEVTTHQSQPPGAVVNPRTRIHVVTACHYQRTAMECSLRTIQATADGAQGLTGGGDALNVSLTAKPRHACRLRTSITVSVLDPEGRRIDSIQGNPLRRTFDLQLGPKGRVYGTMAWTNWCGSAHHVWLAIGLNGSEVSSHRIQAPECVSSHLPSRLDPLNQSGAGSWLFID